MILAAISFSDPVMLAGLAAAAIPVALHLLNRIRSPIVPFPTLRFLKITAQKTSRRRQVQQYLLLLIRMAVFAMIAMAISRPLIRGGSSSLAYGFVVMFLAGLGLLVLAGAWGAEAMRKKSGDAAASDSGNLPDKSNLALPASRSESSRGRATRGAGKYWGLSTAAAVAAILLAGYSAFGLTSDAYFSGDKGEFSGSSTAMVVVLDNSYSMLAREDAASRLQEAKDQVRQLLADTVKPAEAAILVTNPGGVDVSEDQLTADMTRLLGYVDRVRAVGKARPMKERIATAAQILQGSSQASRMLVVVSDFARSAFDDAEVFAALKESAAAKDIQVVLMPMDRGSAPADVGISSFRIAEGGGQPVVGSEITFQAQVVNSGDAAESKYLSLAVDDVPVADLRPKVELGAGGTGSSHAMIDMAYRLTQPGAHRFTLRLEDVKDAMAWDDQRELVLNVADQVRVLVVGPQDRPAARSAAFYMNAALAPFAEGTGGAKAAAGGKMIAWSIKPTYRNVAALKDAASLAGYSAVFMCDVPRIGAELADALAGYVKNGGRVVWVLGPSVDGAAYNRVLLANGRDLLPAPLGAPMYSAAGSTVDWVDIQSPLFAGLFDNQEPFRSVVVTGRWSLAGGVLARGRPLGKLLDGSIILAKHSGPGGAGADGESGGAGDVYTLLTSPSASWSNLGATVLLVPMASRMALGDSGKFRAETSFDSGQSLLIPVPSADHRMNGDGGTLDVTTPAKAVINVQAVKSGDSPRWYFDRTQEVGLYRWSSSDGKRAGMFVVNPPGEEVDLQPADAAELGREVGTSRPAIVAGNAGELLTQLQTRSQGTSLSPGVLAMVLILAVIEALMANRHRPATRGIRTIAVAPGATEPGERAAA